MMTTATTMTTEFLIPKAGASRFGMVHPPRHSETLLLPDCPPNTDAPLANAFATQQLSSRALPHSKPIKTSQRCSHLASRKQTRPLPCRQHQQTNLRARLLTIDHPTKHDSMTNNGASLPLSSTTIMPLPQTDRNDVQHVVGVDNKHRDRVL